MSNWRDEFLVHSSIEQLYIVALLNQQNQTTNTASENYSMVLLSGHRNYNLKHLQECGNFRFLSYESHP